MHQRAPKATPAHRKNFTELMVERLKPPTVRKDASGNPCGVIDYYDTLLPGLILRVNYGGMKVWRVRYYVRVFKERKNDKEARWYTEQRLRKLGRYPALKLQAARDAARPFLNDWQKAIRQADASTIAGTFQEVAANFIKRHVDKEGLRSKPEIVRCLNKYVYPHWQHRPFTELRRGDVTALLDKIEDEHGPRQADMVLAIISKMCNWFLSRNDDYVSPVVRGMRRTKKENGGNGKRFLDDKEIRAVWTACANMGTFGAIVKIALLTGQRREKVAAMKWDDLKDGKWIIPAEPREKSTGGTLRLSKLAIDLIEAQQRISKNPYVFAAGKGNGSFNSFSQRKNELDGKLPKNMPHWVLHDLRRTCRKLMTRAGVRPDVAELALGHSIKGIQQIYDDRGEYEPMIGHALECVANEIDKIINPPPANVVAMKRRTRKG
jgi:integrase